LLFGGTDWADEKRNSVKDTPSASSSFAFLRLVGATKQEVQHTPTNGCTQRRQLIRYSIITAAEGGAYETSRKSRGLIPGHLGVTALANNYRTVSQ
jgi:hypothetical protein